MLTGKENSLQRVAVDHPADDELGQRAAQGHQEGGEADQRQQVSVSGQPLLQQLRQQQREGVEHQAGRRRRSASALSRLGAPDAGGLTEKDGGWRGCCSRAQGMRSHSNPTTAQSRPGAMKAARQPSCLARNAVTTGASATPKLPNTPFTPIERPGFSPAASTSIGVPTGGRSRRKLRRWPARGQHQGEGRSPAPIRPAPVPRKNSRH